MSSTSITESAEAWRESGFGLLEFLVVLALSLSLLIALAPVVVSLEHAGAEEADRTTQIIQASVALARFERDIRLAGALNAPFATSGPLLQAEPLRIVLLTQLESQWMPFLVEWEIVGSSLMRRWGPCPGTCPDTFMTSLFIDNKTMLEGVRPGSRFVYTRAETELNPPLAVNDLVTVDCAGLSLAVSPAGMSGITRLRSSAWVGR